MSNPTPRPTPQFIRIDPLAESALSGLGNRDVTRYLELAKLIVHRYLEECIRPDGQFRQFFDRFANFSHGFVVNQNLDQDPDKRHIQIARFFEDLKESPAQIFIQTTGHEYQPVGPGGITDGWNTRDGLGTQVVQVTDVVKIPVQITCAALSQQEIDDLAALMAATFGQFQKWTCNYILRAQPTETSRSQWELRLPPRYRIANMRHDKLHDDPRQQVWSVQCDLDCVLENSVLLSYRARPSMQLDETPETFEVQVPTVLLVRQNFSVPLNYYPPRCAIYSTDPRVATVDRDETSLTIRPRRPGTFTLMATTEDGDQQGCRILLQQVITVRAR